MKIIVVDIETAPVEINNIPEVNLQYLLEKNKSKRTQKIFEMDGSRITGLGPGAIGMPELNRIICCCVFDGEHYNAHTGAEKEILESVAPDLRDAGKVVGFNSNSFDLPMLKVRGLLNSVNMPIPFSIKAWDEVWFDIRNALTDRYGIGDLAYWARVFEIEPPKWGIEDKSDLSKYPIEDVVKGCKEDCRCTWELFQKIQGIG